MSGRSRSKIAAGFTKSEYDHITDYGDFLTGLDRLTPELSEALNQKVHEADELPARVSRKRSSGSTLTSKP